MTEPASSQLCAAWATGDDLPETRPELLAPNTWDDLLLAASEILWALSGRQWSGEGDCTATARLTNQRGCAGWLPIAAYGVPAPGSGFIPCLSSPQQELQLPHREAREVLSVTAGGEAFAAYELQGMWLHRTDGRGWFELADVEIEYRWGLAPPMAGKLAAVAYAVELGKALANDSSCRLPKRVVSITRQGVSMALIDPQKYLDNGKLGLPDIDQWLAAVNPKHVAAPATIWSPDVPQARAVT